MISGPGGPIDTNGPTMILWVAADMLATAAERLQRPGNEILRKTGNDEPGVAD